MDGTWYFRQALQVQPHWQGLDLFRWLLANQKFLSCNCCLLLTSFVHSVQSLDMACALAYHLKSLVLSHLLLWSPETDSSLLRIILYLPILMKSSLDLCLRLDAYSAIKIAAAHLEHLMSRILWIQACMLPLVISCFYHSWCLELPCMNYQGN